MEQQSFFDRIFGTAPQEMVRNTDPDTSVNAANSIDSTQLEAMVYEVIAKHPDGLSWRQTSSCFEGRRVVGCA
jgi:hypothetical protein